MGVIGVGQITLFDQNDTPIASLTNYAHPVPCAADGSSPDLTGAVSTFQILLAGIDITNLYTVTATPLSGITGTLATYTYTVATMTIDAGYVDFTATRPGFATLTKRFSLSKMKHGAVGETGPQGVDSPACLGLFDYADRGTITGMVSGSLAVLYSATVGERGIYAYVSSTWTRQAAPTPDQIARTWLFVLDAVRQGYGVSSHYVGSSTAFEIIMVKFLYLLKARLETSGAIYSGGYDENGNVSQDGAGNDLPGAFISGTGAFAGVGAIFKSLIANVLKTTIAYNGTWLQNNTYSSETSVNAFSTFGPSLRALSGGRAVCVYRRTSDGYIVQKIRSAAGVWGSETVINGLGYPTNKASFTTLPDGRSILVYQENASPYYLYERVCDIGGTWGAPVAITDTNAHSPSISEFSDGRVICIYRTLNGYIRQRIRSTAGVWSGETTVNGAYSDETSILVLADQTVLCVYRRDSDGYLVQRIRDTAGSWGSETVVNGIDSELPSLTNLPNGTVMCVYQNVSGYLVQRIWNGSSWTSETTISGTYVYDSAVTVLTTGAILFVYVNNSGNNLIQRIDSSLYSSIPIGNFQTDVGSGVVEVGQNTNGTYVKFGDGTMICWRHYSQTATGGWGGSVSLPATFINTLYDVMATNSNASINDTTYRVYKAGRYQTTALWLAYSDSPTQSCEFSIIAIGRWK